MSISSPSDNLNPSDRVASLVRHGKGYSYLTSIYTNAAPHRGVGTLQSYMVYRANSLPNLATRTHLHRHVVFLTSCPQPRISTSREAHQGELPLVEDPGYAWPARSAGHRAPGWNQRRAPFNGGVAAVGQDRHNGAKPTIRAMAIKGSTSSWFLAELPLQRSPRRICW